jgi:hypothetical protein
VVTHTLTLRFRGSLEVCLQSRHWTDFAISRRSIECLAEQRQLGGGGSSGAAARGAGHRRGPFSRAAGCRLVRRRHSGGRAEDDDQNPVSVI